LLSGKFFIDSRGRRFVVLHSVKWWLQHWFVSEICYNSSASGANVAATSEVRFFVLWCYCRKFKTLQWWGGLRW